MGARDEGGDGTGVRDESPREKPERNRPSSAAGEERGVQEMLPSLPTPAGSPRLHMGLVAQLSPWLQEPDPSWLWDKRGGHSRVGCSSWQQPYT